MVPQRVPCPQFPEKHIRLMHITCNHTTNIHHNVDYQIPLAFLKFVPKNICNGVNYNRLLFYLQACLKICENL